jgi:peptidoglycan L-alanyl-D-glutamate endopeptidase CwlK
MQSRFKLGKKELVLLATTFVIGIAFYLIFSKKTPRDYTKYKWYKNENGRKMVEKLHPKFKPLVKEWMSDVEDKLGLEIYPTSGFRTYAEQARLHANNSGNAKPGYSYHNFGLAIDVNVKKDGKIIIVKNDTLAKWKDSGVVDAARKVGLEWIGKFGTYHDPVHFQYELGSKTTSDLRASYDAGKKDSNGYVLV